MWRGGALEAENFSLEQVSDYLGQKECLVWADLCAPDSALLDRLAAELHLDANAVEDAANFHERPKALRYASHLFVGTFAVVDQQAQQFRLSRVSAFVLPNAMITVRLDDSFDIDEVVHRWDDNADLIPCGSRALLHGLLDVVVDGYFDAIEKLDDRVEDIEDALFQDEAAAMKAVQRRTFDLRKDMTHLRRIIMPMREVVNTVMRRLVEYDSDHRMVPYYEDLYDHVVRAAEWTDAMGDMISSIHDTSLSLSDLRMNLVMKKLTGWAAIVAVPTAITGFYGQNVPYPGVDRTWGFWFSTLAIVLIAVALYGVFKRKDWL